MRHILKYAAILILVVVCLTGMSSAANALVPTGIYYLENVNSPTDGSGNNLSNTITLSYVDGATLRWRWATMETASGVYNFSGIDADLTLISSAGKHAQILLAAGQQSPCWLKNLGAVVYADNSTFDTNCTNNPTETFQTADTTSNVIPVPWDTTYQTELGKFITALAAHLTQQGTLSLISGVVVTGIAQATAEVKLCCTIGASGCPGTCQGDTAGWTTAGYTRAKVQNAWTTFLNDWANAFPNAGLSGRFVNDAMPSGFPPTGCSGTDTLYPRELNDLGYAVYPTRYMFGYNGLDNTATSGNLLNQMCPITNSPSSLWADCEDANKSCRAGSTDLNTFQGASPYTLHVTMEVLQENVAETTTFSTEWTNVQNNLTNVNAIEVYPAGFTATNQASLTAAHNALPMQPVVPTPGIILNSAPAFTSQANTTSLAATLPSSGIDVGDWIGCLIGVVGAATITPPSGYVLVPNTLQSTSPTTGLYYHISNGTDPATVTFTSSVSGNMAAICANYEGVDNTTPVVAAASQHNAGSLTATSPSVTAAANNQLLMLYMSLNTQTFGTPSKGTLVASGGPPSAAWVDFGPLSAGATGAQTIPNSVSAASTGIQIALNPSGTPNGPTFSGASSNSPGSGAGTPTDLSPIARNSTVLTGAATEPGSLGTSTGFQRNFTPSGYYIGGMVSLSTLTLQSIAVSPPSTTINIGAQQTYTATGIYTDNSQRDITPQCTWASNNPSIATMSGATATGVGAGTATITCTTSVAPTLQSIAVSPPSATINAGAQQIYTATGTYSDNSQHDITAQCAWASGNTAIATMSGATATGVAAGTDTITCTAS